MSICTFFANKESVTVRAASAVCLLVAFGSDSRIYASANPIPASLLQARFPQTKVGTCDFDHPEAGAITNNLMAGSIKIQEEKDTGLTLSGTDQMGKAWKLSVVDGSDGCSAWQADLDGNGQQDLILLMKYSTSEGDYGMLTVILIDQNGRPIPWHSIGLFDADANGVREIVDFNKDHHAEILDVYREGNQFDGLHFAVSVYRAEQAQWKRVSGSYGGVTLPLLINATDSFKKQQQKVDLSTMQSAASTPVKIASFDSKSGEITFSDGNRARLPEMMLVEDPSGTLTGTIGVSDSMLAKNKSGRPFREIGRAVMRGRGMPALSDVGSSLSVASPGYG